MAEMVCTEQQGTAAINMRSPCNWRFPGNERFPAMVLRDNEKVGLR